jgi:hypothetical protein
VQVSPLSADRKETVSRLDLKARLRLEGHLQKVVFVSLETQVGTNESKHDREGNTCFCWRLLLRNKSIDCLLFD